MENVSVYLRKFKVQELLSSFGKGFTRTWNYLRSLHEYSPAFERVVRSAWFPFTGLLPLVFGGYIIYRSLPALQEFAGGRIPPVKTAQAIAADSMAYAFRLAEEEKEALRLKKSLSNFTPRKAYLVINTTDNRFRLYAGSKLTREGICSTGSYTMLTDGKERTWYFQTPKGVFKIRDKKTDPVWKKPDWAFVEEGLPVPSANHTSRFEYGTLGDYALLLGDGYMIHGTLYQRFLGLPVTHGCVRLGDDDLKVVYQTLPVGSPVYIY